MKRFLSLIFGLMIFGAVSATTINLNWLVDGDSYAQTTCESGGDLNLPQTPTKYGHVFTGWNKLVRLDYIEFTGTQKIDTGVSGFDSGNWVIYIRWMLTNSVQDSYAQILKVGTDNMHRSYQIVTNGTNGTQLMTNVNTYFNSGSASFNIAINEIHVGTLYTTNRSITIDDKTTSNTGQTGTIASNGIPSYATMYIGNAIKGRIYDAWAKQDGVYKYNLIPVMDSTGAIGFYDTVSQKILTNSGTGTLVAGPVSVNQSF